MTSLIQTDEYKKAVLTVMVSRFSNLEFLTNRTKNRVRKCYVYKKIYKNIFLNYYFISIDGALDAFSVRCAFRIAR